MNVFLAFVYFKKEIGKPCKNGANNVLGMSKNWIFLCASRCNMVEGNKRYIRSNKVVNLRPLQTCYSRNQSVVEWIERLLLKR